LTQVKEEKKTNNFLQPKIQKKEKTIEDEVLEEKLKNEFEINLDKIIEKLDVFHKIIE
jgi:hypothetical protein